MSYLFPSSTSLPSPDPFRYVYRVNGPLMISTQGLGLSTQASTLAYLLCIITLSVLVYRLPRFEPSNSTSSLHKQHRIPLHQDHDCHSIGLLQSSSQLQEPLQHTASHQHVFRNLAAFVLQGRVRGEDTRSSQAAQHQSQRTLLPITTFNTQFNPVEPQLQFSVRFLEQKTVSRLGLLLRSPLRPFHYVLDFLCWIGLEEKGEHYQRGHSPRIQHAQPARTPATTTLSPSHLPHLECGTLTL